MRIASITVIYSEILNMRMCAMNGKSTGHVVTLTSTDVERFSLASMFWPYLVFAPIESCVVLVILIFEIGFGALAGFGILLGIFLPIQFWFSQSYAKLRLKAAQYTDQRVKLMSEVISGARVMKCYAWENAISDRVKQVRGSEIRYVKRTAALRGLNEGLYFACVAIVGLVMFSVYIASGGLLTPRKVFVSLTLILVIQLDMTKFFAFGVKESSEAIVAANRIGNFLLQVEGSTNGNRRSSIILNRGSMCSVLDRPGSSLAQPLVTVGSSKPKHPQNLTEYHPNSSVDGSSDTKSLASIGNLHSMAGISMAGGVSMATISECGGGYAQNTTQIKDNNFGRENVSSNPVGLRYAIEMRNVEAVWQRDRSGGTFADDDASEDGDPAENANDNNIYNDNNNFKAAVAKSKPFTLQGIDLKITQKSLVAVVGAVGCGKTSLLMAILGEMYVCPQPEVQGTCAYVSQDPWVLSATVRDNILFGLTFDPVKYERVLQACCLHSDLKVLPAGDQTFVGERGVTLSGGQKARVALARAAYSNANIMLLDDPLSAVDPKVGRELFSRCILGLMGGRTRIVVTHQLQYARRSDRVVVMEEGRVAADGIFDHIQSRRDLNLTKFLNAKMEEEEGNGNSEIKEKGFFADLKKSRYAAPSLRSANENKAGDSEHVNSNETTPSSPETTQNTKENILSSSQSGLKDAKPAGETISEAEEDKALNKAREKAVKDDAKERAEGREIGKVRWSIFLSYVRSAGSNFLLVTLVAVTVAGQVILLLTSWYFGLWAEQDADAQASFYWIGIAALLALVCLLWSAMRAVWVLVAMVGASQRLHDRMFQKVVRLPCRFFDTNPSGRVLNRFSKDIGFADDLMPQTFFDMCAILLRVIAVIILVCIINPVLFIAVIPLLVGFYFVQQRYIKTSREVKRLEAVSRSPVYSQISETLQGMASIRSYTTQDQFRHQFFDRIDRNVEGWFAFIACARWLGIRLDALTLFFTTCVLYAGILMQSQGFRMDEGLVGLSLAYLVQLGDAFQWSVRQIAEFENQLVSVERILAYTNLKPEAPLSLPTDTSRVPTRWPVTGELKFVNFSARYAKTLPRVLQSINVTIPGKSKVAIVGRTGAGKSSLIQCIFRLIEADSAESKLLIDGVAIGEIGLHPLRKAVGVIPQTPWLFSGSIRENLDPFDEHSDKDLWAALGDVQLKSVFKSLEDWISEAGSNLSAGQKQLVCLARAILRNSRVLVCDEATANVDLKTDEIIQSTIRSNFSECTVITIAHRLNTIIDVDIVVVLDKGRVVEVGHPHELLQDIEVKGEEKDRRVHGSEGSRRWFAEMVRDTGKENEKLLRVAARDAYLKSRNGPAQKRCS